MLRTSESGHLSSQSQAAGDATEDIFQDFEEQTNPDALQDEDHGDLTEFDDTLSEDVTYLGDLYSEDEEEETTRFVRRCYSD